MKVGFAGLGLMGVHMARRIQAQGFSLMVWNRGVDKAEGFADHCVCEIARTPRELAEQCEIVISMLANDHASSEVHLEEQGLFSAANAPPLFIEMGTLSPEHFKTLQAKAPLSSRVVDCPVSGATAAAKAGTLMIMVGATESESQGFSEVLRAMGDQLIFLEKSGRAVCMKLSINSLLHGINQSFAEALTLAEHCGIDSELAYDAIEASAACAPMLHYRRRLYLQPEQHDVSFKLELALKDMAVTVALAKKKKLELPQASLNLSLLEAACDAGFAHRDMAQLLDFTKEKNSGI